MSTIHEQLTEAADEAARVVANTKPEQFGDKTPCTQWDVKELLNHLMLWTAYSFERRARSEQVGPDLTERDFAAEPDYAARYRAQLDRALAAWTPAEVWESEIDTGSGKTPAPQIAEMILMEMVLHAWDLATATGQPYAVSDEVAAIVGKAVEASAEMYRQYDGFAAEAPVGQDATVLDKALAVSGRKL
ncbi:TIGR03086 family protein [Catenulispora sp. NL8]|uniref:TIGR03086 family protein n=1 Tax=Catenulispora pinistramenti TaxID=2705254 RepID=A0ABS5L821_9ACTN|nr:TIGR03086 family metal-binding protein [Catenulispora pinistramenti]MBS2554491.1 TIGR03086 family protein [Catenulispora pinistramenti]